MKTAELRKLIQKILKENVLSEDIYSVFHGTNNDFDEFDYDKIGSNTESLWNGHGFYFSDSKSEAGLHGKNVKKFQIQLKNPLRIDKVKNTSVNGSGLIRLFSGIDGLRDLVFNGRKIFEINDIIVKLEHDAKKIKIELTQGIKDWFKDIWFEYEGKEYVIRSNTDAELSNKNYIENMLISKILYKKYDIISLPIRIKEIINPYYFTKIAKENGYDGVIAPNSTVSTGNEYVVFDKENIKPII